MKLIMDAGEEDPKSNPENKNPLGEMLILERLSTYAHEAVMTAFKRVASYQDRILICAHNFNLLLRECEGIGSHIKTISDQLVPVCMEWVALYFYAKYGMYSYRKWGEFAVGLVLRIIREMRGYR